MTHQPIMWIDTVDGDVFHIGYRYSVGAGRIRSAHVASLYIDHVIDLFGGPFVKQVRADHKPGEKFDISLNIRVHQEAAA